MKHKVKFHGVHAIEINGQQRKIERVDAHVNHDRSVAMVVFVSTDQGRGAICLHFVPIK